MQSLYIADSFVLKDQAVSCGPHGSHRCGKGKNNSKVRDLLEMRLESALRAKAG